MLYIKKSEITQELINELIEGGERFHVIDDNESEVYGCEDV